MTDGAPKFLETVWASFYEGVTHAGILLVRLDEEPQVFLTQRATDETDDPDVRDSWETPGGGIEPGEDPLAAAAREFEEEVGFPLPEHKVVHGWRAGPEDNYQGFVAEALDFPSLDDWQPTSEVQDAGWFTVEEARSMALRPEFAATDLAALVAKVVSGNEEKMDEPEMVDVEDTELDEPELSMADLSDSLIPVHGVLAPEDTESGDSRGFNSGAVTQRPYRLPFMWQEAQTSGHDNAVVVGSVDRLMRKDGVIHWEGSLMPTAKAGEFAEMLAFFGRFGVSVDGDRGGLDAAKSEETGVVWFEAVRAAGLTAVSIPAFAEAYVAFGPHPDMPELSDDAESDFSVMTAAGDMVAFERGPGWVTNPKETRRIHAYWTKKGQPGYAKIRWGTPGDFTRAKKLIGAKIAANSPEDMKYLNQIIAQWHHDALGYWPGELDKPGNKTSAEARAERKARMSVERAIERESIEADDEGNGWEAVLTSSGAPVPAPLSYFHQHPETGPLTIEPADEFGIRRVHGYAAKWGVCHVGMSGRCVEPPRTWSNDYPDFHLGRIQTSDGPLPTGVLTYGVGHRDAETILSESADQAFFDNLNNAWASVRVGEDDFGIWFSGVVLPDVPEEHLTKIAASGQVSGEWLAGAMRACLTVNVPGFPVHQPSVEYDNEGNVLALAASAFGQEPDAPCEPTPAERMQALAMADAEARWDLMKTNWKV